MKLSHDVIFRKLADDDGILINLNTKNYYSLNETAVFIVSRIKKGLENKKILADLYKSFNADKKTLSKDFSAIVSDLKRENMLS